MKTQHFGQFLVRNAIETSISEAISGGKLPDFDLSKPMLYELPGGRQVEVFDSVSDHLAVLKMLGFSLNFIVLHGF